MNKIPYMLRAVLAILAGVGVVILGTLISRGGATWQSCLGLLLLLIGLPITVGGAMLLMREQWIGGVAPGTYYTYTCPHCGGSIHSRETPISEPISCPYCGNKFTPKY
jgi:DNA-directed RNA polymerase subunit RPC12/RpoP